MSQTAEPIRDRFIPIRAMSPLESAIWFANQLHAGQLDKSGEPYILHPLAVMLAVPPKEEVRVVAVLHDVVEDCNYPVEYLRVRFGVHVADAVDALSKRHGERYSAYIQRVSNNPIAREVKIADLNHNLSRLDALDPITAKRLGRRYVQALMALKAGER